MSKEKSGLVAVSMRLPQGLYRKLAAMKRRKPYLSMNAIIIEELTKELGNGKEKASA